MADHCFVGAELALKSFSVGLTLKRRFIDSDDVKVIVDGEIKRNHRSISHKFWYFIAVTFTGEKQSETFPINLSSALHYLEFHADRMPILHNTNFDFGQEPQIPEVVPSTNKPKWTEDFYDDTEEILLSRAIYGEAGGESYEAKIAVAWSIRNRVEDPKQRWGKTYHDVILWPSQYEPFTDPDQAVFKKITEPPADDSIEGKAWQESFQAAKAVFLGKVSDPTKGANHFLAKTANPWPSWATEDAFTIEVGGTNFYRL